MVVDSFMGSIENPVLTAVSKTIAPIFDPVILIVLSLIVAIYLYMKSSKAKAILFGGIMVLAGGIIWAAKETFQRERPFDALLPEMSYSFPSGHATIAVVFFGLLVYLFLKGKYGMKASIVAGVLVLIIGLSRLYLRVHWLTDVLGGFVIGGVILAAGIWVSRNKIK